MKRADRMRTRAFPAAPPPPEQTTALVQQGVDVNRGNSNQQPLAPSGVQEAKQVGAALVAKGGLDNLKTGGSARGDQTAQIIGQADPKLPVERDGDIQSWAQGNLEGQPAALVRDQIRDLVRNNPSQKIPGQGALSSRPGESFDDFRTSRLSAIRGAMQELAQNPQAKIGRVTHSQVIKLVNGWLANGTPDDFAVKPEAMEDHSEKPGQVERLFPTEGGKWKTEAVNMESGDQLQPGVYLIRHGMTPWNKETYEKANGAQDAMAQITKAAKGMDWARAAGHAQQALAKGHLTEQQIEQTIDAALPDPQKAAKLPLHRLMAVASAASPARRQEYIAAIQQYPGMNELPPDAQAQITDHLRLIGA
jgi:broad specificity phosphatase PhoE